MFNPVELEKSKGNYRLAGQLARLRGDAQPIYGCHYGMRSERLDAIEQYTIGYAEIDTALKGYCQ